ncbi:MAG: hypothetical protein EOO09_04990 [Chitinophagaceae bacterium]|nr:MAG: hypothetical protein EOO09_04990 [Chitinophagaceae bacterium]
MKYIAILLFVFAAQTTGAQTVKELLERKKQEARMKLDQKADQKGSEAIDSAIAAPGTVIRKTKEKKARKKLEKENDITAAGNNEATEVAPLPVEPEGTQLVIETNILCEQGQEKMEARLRKQPAVYDVSVDISSGDLSIRFRSALLNYATIVEMINNAGFTADDKKPAAGAPANPCKKKP